MNILLLVALVCAAGAGAAAQTFEKQIRVAPPAEGERYFYVPFEVPPRTESLSVSYEYDRRDGANTLDLGLFAPCEGGAPDDLCGFRGWSGGRRATVFLASDRATHGYLPGKIPAGRWRVALGLYKVAPEGVEVKIKVRFNEIDAQAEADRRDERSRKFDFGTAAGRRSPEDFGGYRWYRGDLHMHTFHSDGHWTVAGLARAARAGGLDFLAITDHNTSAHHADIDALDDREPLVIRGEEVTTYGGHFNVWGLPSGRMIDFRVAPGDARRAAAIWAAAREAGALVSINHPAAVCGGCGWSYGDETWAAVGAAEIWNGAWDWQDEAALKKWDELLAKGQRIVATGASDSHRPPGGDAGRGEPIGTPANFVGAARLSEKEILDAIRAGRVWVAQNPRDVRLTFAARPAGEKASPVLSGGLLTKRAGEPATFEFSGHGFPAGARVRLVSAGRVVRETAADDGRFSARFETAADDAYFRLEVRDAGGAMLALTNPIYLTTANPVK